MKELTQERLKEVLYYDREMGVFTWLVDRGSVKAGDIAGCMNSGGYIQIMIDGELYIASVLAWFYVEEYWPENIIDHENRIRSDNRWSNLRHVTYQCNNRNRRMLKNNTSGVTGVNFNKITNKWQSQISINNKNRSLGHYKDFDKAVKARWEGELKYGFPNCNTDSMAYNYLVLNNLI